MNFKGASGTGAFIEDDAAVNALVDTDVVSTKFQPILLRCLKLHCSVT